MRRPVGVEGSGIFMVVTAVAAASLVMLCPPTAVAVPPVTDTAFLDEDRGIRFLGLGVGARAGTRVASLGDVNGNGADDIIISAPFTTVEGVFGVGVCYVVFGSPDGDLPPVIDVAQLDGTNGFRIVGSTLTPVRLGLSVAGAGDINGDGYMDIMIGSPDPRQNPTTSGVVHVIYGGPDVGAGGEILLSQLDGKNGFVMIGETIGDGFGFSVAGVGDVNGDGVDDMLIGAPSVSVNGLPVAGAAYVVFGGDSIEETLDGRHGFVASELTGENGYMVRGIAFGDNTGVAVAGAGDVNGDGVNDFMISAPEARGLPLNRIGDVYLLYGGADVGASGALDLGDLQPSQGVILRGADFGDLTGWGLGAGDVTNDGSPDLLIGAPTATPEGERSGRVFVVRTATADLASGEVMLGQLDGVNGFIVNGARGDTPDEPGDTAGFNIVAADIDGDGIEDLIIAAPSASGFRFGAGAVHVLFGRSGLGSEGVIELADFNPSDRAIIHGPANAAVFSRGMAAVGDFNGDGVADVLAGTPGVHGPGGVESGGAILLFGIQPIPGDVNCDGVVNSYDLSMLLGLWGTDDRRADFNRDGVVNSSDLGILLSHWGERR
ncbi:MAG: hypothetical protein EA376_01640 [Phycisphaeraceae bacterium]|nr:MAG: hypothetical protein EA376_01640 [Phycisphaeraceae bacterium]